MPTQYTTPDYNQERLNQLKALFPDLFTTEGQLDKAEFTKLTLLNDPQRISTHDRYSFAWSGKTLAKQHAFAPSLATLTHDKERSYHNKFPLVKGVSEGQGFVTDSKPHIIIEGENLEVLKQLQSAYYEQIKCIYIDPPYNTGKDFVYSDNFTQGKQAYWQESGQTDEYGVKITTNTESSGRYHSDWLSMIYSRLLLARQLLTDDGVIFVSIDDNEVHNLRKVMDEVFGEENFVAQLIWKKKQGGGNDSKHIVVEHEYIISFTKNKEVFSLDLDKEYVLDDALYPFEDEKGEFGLVTLDKSSIQFSQSLVFEIQDDKGNKYLPRIIKGKQSCWRWGKEKVKIDFGDLVFKDGKVYTKYYRPTGVTPKSLLIDSRFGRTETGQDDMKIIFDNNTPFSYPKPVNLIKHFLRLCSKESDIILDFFAGSGTTGQAVMELNEADGGNRQCILVQMPELTDQKSEAYKAGYKRISDITIERNKRVIQGYGKTPKALSIGFEVFRLEQSNFPVNQWRPDPELDDDQNVVEFEKYVEAKEASLFSELDPTKAILEIAIKEGLKLDYTQTKMKDFAANQVLQLSDDSRTILVCVDPKVELATVELLAKNYKESKFICLERAIDTTTKWNLNHNLGAGFKSI